MVFFGLFKNKWEKLKDEIFCDSEMIKKMVDQEDIENLIIIVSKAGTSSDEIYKNFNNFTQGVKSRWGLAFIGSKAVKPVISSSLLSKEQKKTTLVDMSTLGPKTAQTIQELTKCITENYNGEGIEFYISIGRDIENFENNLQGIWKK